MVKVRVYISGVLVGEETVKGPLAVHKPAPVAKKQGKAAAPFSRTEHMQAMFTLFMRSGSGRGLRQGTVGLNDLYAVYCAGFTEGVWTERVHPGGKPPGLKKEAGDGDD